MFFRNTQSHFVLCIDIYRSRIVFFPFIIRKSICVGQHQYCPYEQVPFTRNAVVR